MKKVLMIAYSFPPAGGGRVRRAVKFAKYLRRFGWEPVVLTAKKPVVPDYDYTLMDAFPSDIKIIRTPSLEISRSFRRMRQKGRQRGDVFSRMINGIRDWVLLPDSRIGWMPFVILRSLSVIRSEKIDVIFVMGEPFSSFISGAILKMLTKKPLVLDFRDEWVEFNRYFSPSKSALAKKIEEHMEAFVVKKADAVISVTEDIINNFRNKYCYLEKEKFICITNGFDPDDYAGISASGNNERFVISYAGCLYKNRSPRYFLEGVNALIKERPDIKKRIKLIFIGSVTDGVEDLFSTPGLNEVVEFLGFLPFNKTLQHLADSDVLLYIEDQVEIPHRLLPAKIFEYLALKKPIIALARSPFLKEIITKSNAGRVVPSNEPELAKQAIEEYFTKFIKGNPMPKTDEVFIRQFERGRLTEKLGLVLDSVGVKNKRCKL